MVRPRIKRHLKFNPNVRYFKPQGIPMRMLEEVILELDEIEVMIIARKGANDTQ